MGQARNAAKAARRSTLQQRLSVRSNLSSTGRRSGLGASHLKRGTDAPNDEDGRDLRLSAADRSATEFYAAMIAPSGARPSVTKRQIAIKSLRAKATIVMRRIRP